MKRLYLMRHGHAPTPAEAGVKSDALRPLSERGQRDVARMAAELLARGGRPSLVLHSPLKRAAQTAAAVAAALKTARVEEFPALDNTLAPEQVLDALAERGKASDELLAVGHQPQLGEMARLLTAEVLELKPGGLIAIELARPSRRAWSLNPEELGAGR